MPPPAIPSPFDITLDFTNSSCGYSDGTFTFTFTIDGTSFEINQTDADIITTGSFEPETGAFATTGAVGPGVEDYTGTIAFDGTTITVTGTSGYTQNGVTCTSDIAGSSTPLVIVRET